MTIWIFAILLIAAVTLAGWRQGGVRAAFSFVGLLFAALLAAPVGKLFYWLLPHLGVTNPIYVWALAPVGGFILVLAIFKGIAFKVHGKIDQHYKYQAGDLRLKLWERLNARLGLCVGVMNGVVYFLLVSFFLFNLSYWTVQAASEAKPQFIVTRLVNQMGRDLVSTGIARAAAGVGTLSPNYYKLADVTGILMQNPQTGTRLGEYPALTSLWERDDMQGLVTDGAVRGSLSSEATLGDIIAQAPVQDFLKNKELTKVVLGAVETNLDDLSSYLQTGKSAKFDGEKVLGRWEYNVGVSVAWYRQSQPKIQPAELRAIRAAWTQAYAQTSILLTGDNQVFIKSLPRFKGAAPEMINWKGDWSVDGSNYTLHVTFNGEDKFLIASLEGLRLSVKDGKSLMFFDHAD